MEQKRGLSLLRRINAWWNLNNGAEYLREESVVETNKDDTADRIAYVQIDNLNKAVLNFSDNSLEIKKMCVTVLVAAITVIVGIFKDDYSKIVIVSMIAIPFIMFLFYIVDAVMYWFQDKLREGIVNKENAIKERHNLEPGKYKNPKARIWRVLFNGSNLVYFIPLVLVELILFIVKMVYKL